MCWDGNKCEIRIAKYRKPPQTIDMLKLLNKILGLDEDFFTKGEKSTEVPTETAGSDDAVSAPMDSQQTESGVKLSRVDIVQKMWGDGFSVPGSPEFVIGLARPLNLDSQKSVLDLAPGLGGMARTLVTSVKAYITCLERDEEFAREGMHISSRAGHAKHAPITHYDPAKFEYPKKADAVIARELFYSLENKDDVLTRVAGVIKQRGHFLITDFTCDDPAVLEKTAVKEWRNVEPHGVHLVPATDMAKILEKNGFDVRINEDMSKAYSKQILFGITRLAKYLEGKKLSPTTKGIVGREVDRWSKCLAALDAGVKNSRIYAIKAR